MRSGLVRWWYRVVFALALLGPLLAASWSHSADLLGPLVIHGGIHGGDYWSTVTSRGREMNPLINKAGLTPVKIGGFALTYGGDLLIQRKQGRRKWPLRIYRGVLVLGYGYVIQHNRRIR